MKFEHIVNDEDARISVIIISKASNARAGAWKIGLNGVELIIRGVCQIYDEREREKFERCVCVCVHSKASTKV